MSKTRSTTTTRSVTATERRELQKGLQRVEMTREEELVLRMRHGIGAPRTTRLEFRGQNDPELSAKLAMIEADALAQVRPKAEAEVDLEGEALKRAIIERLKRI